MIGEGIILFRIENLEQRCRRITAIVCAELIDFIEHHHRIVYSSPANRLNDAAGHRADIGAAMAAQLCFVAHAAQTQPFEFSSHRARDRTAQRSLADTGSADKTKNWALRVRP